MSYSDLKVNASLKQLLKKNAITLCTSDEYLTAILSQELGGYIPCIDGRFPFEACLYGLKCQNRECAKE